MGRMVSAVASAALAGIREIVARISLASPANLLRLRRALADLSAEVTAVPPFELKFLRKGHAIHFRCQHPEAVGLT